MKLPKIRITRHYSRYSKRRAKKLQRNIERYLDAPHYLWIVGKFDSPLWQSFLTTQQLLDKFVVKQLKYAEWLKKLAEGMCAPLKQPLDYVGIGRKLVITTEVPNDLVGEFLLGGVNYEDTK